MFYNNLHGLTVNAAGRCGFEFTRVAHELSLLISSCLTSDQWKFLLAFMTPTHHIWLATQAALCLYDSSSVMEFEEKKCMNHILKLNLTQKVFDKGLNLNELILLQMENQMGAN